MKITIHLGLQGEDSIEIALYENSFTRKWVKEFQWCLDNCEINQREAFAGFDTLEHSAELLVESCKIINTYLKNFIDIRENILTQPQEYFNYLHSIFERLSGGYGKTTRLFAVANQELKDAIRNLNYYVHRIESRQKVLPLFYLSFNKDQYRRIKLSPEDYDFFEFKFPAGTLFLHYAELGKEFIDLYEDNLNLDYSGFSNLHYYSGEASLAFLDYDVFSDIGYLEWLKNNNIDPYDKKLGHGKVPLGEVLDLDQSLAKIKKHSNIYKIFIEE